MSTVTESYIVCDIQGPGCRKTFGFNSRESVKEQRARARIEGWHYIANEDICPECYCAQDRKQGKKLPD